MPDLETNLRVRHTDGALEPFYREKLLVSLHRSLSHRQEATRDASALTQTLVSNILHQPSSQGIINLSDLRKHAREILFSFDKAAGVHYEAHHQAK